MEKQKEAPIHGDVLAAIFSHVPLIDLLPASQVSSAWQTEVSWSLRKLNPIKPWFFVHVQNTRSPHVFTTHAYDPRSNVWLEIQQPFTRFISTLRSAHSTLLYMLSPSKLILSNDPLHLTWHEIDAPLGWIPDPIVAVVGHHVVIVAGKCDFQNDPLSLKIYDLRTRTWETCESMPVGIKDSVASTWQSIAVDEEKLYVTDKRSGATYSFDPSSKTWRGPFDLRPDQEVFYSVTGFSRDRMIVVGLVGDAENVNSVKVWEVKGENLECEMMGEMPTSLIEKLKGESDFMPSIAMTTMDDFVYIYNPSDPGEVIVCEAVQGLCRWSSVPNVVVNDRTRMQRLMLTCSNVSIEDLNRAFNLGNTKFAINHRE